MLRGERSLDRGRVADRVVQLGERRIVGSRRRRREQHAPLQRRVAREVEVAQAAVVEREQHLPAHLAEHRPASASRPAAPSVAASPRTSSGVIMCSSSNTRPDLGVERVELGRVGGSVLHLELDHHRHVRRDALPTTRAPRVRQSTSVTQVACVSISSWCITLKPGARIAGSSGITTPTDAGKAGAAYLPPSGSAYTSSSIARTPSSSNCSVSGRWKYSSPAIVSGMSSRSSSNTAA